VSVFAQEFCSDISKAGCWIYRSQRFHNLCRFYISLSVCVFETRGFHSLIFISLRSTFRQRSLRLHYDGPGVGLRTIGRKKWLISFMFIHQIKIHPAYAQNFRKF
jgi:hypothetical protein